MGNAHHGPKFIDGAYCWSIRTAPKIPTILGDTMTNSPGASSIPVGRPPLVARQTQRLASWRQPGCLFICLCHHHPHLSPSSNLFMKKSANNLTFNQIYSDFKSSPSMIPCHPPWEHEPFARTKGPRLSGQNTATQKITLDTRVGDTSAMRCSPVSAFLLANLKMDSRFTS